MTPAARIAGAIDLLTAIEAAPRKPADAVANDFFRNRRFIGSGDRRAVSERAWAVIRTRRRLEWWLGHADPSPRLLLAASLLLGGFSLGGVVQSFSGGRFAPAVLSNSEIAVLRRLDGHTLDHPDMPASVRFEMPDWLLPRMESRFGDRLAIEMAALEAPAPLDLRVNLLKSTREQAQAALAIEGIVSERTTLSPWGLRVADRRMVTTGKAFQDGLVEIQDEGSQLVALAVGAAPGMRVADVCAGAGGKTLAMAMTMENRGHIVACDVSAPRLDGAVRWLRRAGVHNVERHLFVTGDKWAKRHAQKFDRVLVDAPCTGIGTWRRNPDARTRLTETDLTELLHKQAAILDDASRLVRTGGILVYATCSLLPEENEGQVTDFLARHPEFTLHPPPQGAGADGAAYLNVTPASHGTDGFFAALLERRT